ncbi:hypothetical protein XENTR_v10006939 [Xenopus tropicalis]|uniref:Uncharacterized protein LOC548667 n=1 Tax=Xenopus tropicalis TaxID=8364 RepID=F7BB47_XENTR|nr:uncharacterized protein LOC548667 [Xenopus tropicalis]KAE8627319.1 hypothetical protein XENTR_v10006939 [Xenopus tropicalis]|eukprot:XP_017946718.1 PREDICTED: uncharacterized protein LOC548667 isoform X1 [Xenopus tropicalis]
MEREANRLEREHVHSVYEKIAPYFSDKRYKAWPKVQEFLLAQEPASLIADIGCGNGKYLHINKEAFKVGCDYCLPLAEDARSHGYEVMVCDGLRLPYRNGCFDAVLSIGVIHHFSTKDRRIQAIREMSRILKIGGQIMIYVWAMEQKKRKFEKQDILVPWHLEAISPNTTSRKLSVDLSRSPNKDSSKVVMAKELQQRTKSASFGGDKAAGNIFRFKLLSRSLDSGLDVNSDGVSNNRKSEQPQPRSFLNRLEDFLPKSMQNFEINVIKMTESLLFPLHNMSSRGNGDEQIGSTEVIKDYSKVALPDMVSTHNDQSRKGSLNQNLSTKPASSCADKLENNAQLDRENHLVPSHGKGECFRYYHIFRKGELIELIEKFVPELHVVQTYFDHSNWCVVAEKIHLWEI